MRSSELQKVYSDSPNPNSVEEGLEFEDFAREQIIRKGIVVHVNRSARAQFAQGDAAQGVEFKRDNRCTDTGRLSIEYEERVNTSRMWVKAGVLRDDDVWLYVQGNEKRFWAFSKKMLAHMHRLSSSGDLPLESGEIATLRKFYVPIKLADEICLFRYPDDF